MLPTKLVYSKDYNVDIGLHVFPTIKYPLLKEKLLEGGIACEEDFIEPEYATREDLLLVHSEDYVKKLLEGTLADLDIARLELPYSKKLVDSSIRCAGGTILASKLALKNKLGIHLGGGFHHAFPDHGEGFCVLNDIAIAIKKLLKEKLIKKAFVIDCDLHQGNGTAAIFQNDPGVFTFSIHEENNYPFYKPESSLDIGLNKATGDKEYLKRLQKPIPEIISKLKPDFLVFVAGADVYKHDQLGTLNLSIGGIKERDSFVFKEAKKNSIPLALVLAGGYAKDLNDTVAIHYNTVKEGLNILC